MKIVSRLALTLALSACMSIGAQAQDLVKIATGQTGNWVNWAPEFGRDLGVFKKHNLTLEFFYTSGAAETQQAVLSGSSDVGMGVGTMGILGAFSKGAPVRVIGATMRGMKDQFWYVAANSPIRTMADTGGKTVSFTTVGATTHIAVLGFQEHYKVPLKPIASAPVMANYTQVMTGQIDVGTSGGVYLLDAADDGKIRIIARADEIPDLAAQTTRMIITSAQTLERRRDVLVRYMAAYRESLDLLYSHPDALKAYAQAAKVPLKIAERVRRDVFDSKEPQNPDMIAGLDKAMSDAIKFKYITAPLTADQVKTLLVLPLK